MKVLLVNSVLGVGSTGKIVNELYKLIKNEGHECKIAYGRDNNTKIPNEDLIKIGSKLDFNLHVALSRVTDLSGFYSKKATEEMIKEIKVFDPDIIHLHNIHGYYINVEILFDYIKENNKKIIWTLHDCWPYTGHCAYYDYVKCNKWQTQCFSCPEKRSYPKSIVFDNSKSNYETKKNIFNNVNNLTIVTPSKWLKNEVKKSFLNNYRVEVINNGIDIGVFKPTESNLREKYNLSDKRVVLGVASVWDRRKGLEFFVELEKKLDKSYKIVLIGLNKKQIEELPGGIIGISRTESAEELAKWYTLAYVYLNPTLEDNYPTTNIESICCKTPVVTFNTGGSPEIAQKYGIVTENKDTESILIALEKIKNLKQCENIDKIISDYNSSITYINYLRLYQGIN